MQKLFFVLLFTALIINGCSSGNKVTELIEGRWSVISLLGKTITTDETEKGFPSINFGENGKFFGSTGCNNYTGFFNINGNSISMNPGSMTKMMCPGNVEQNFLNAIKQTRNFKFNGDKLILLNKAKEVMSLVEGKK